RNVRRGRVSITQSPGEIRNSKSEGHGDAPRSSLIQFYVRGSPEAKRFTEGDARHQGRKPIAAVRGAIDDRRHRTLVIILQSATERIGEQLFGDALHKLALASRQDRDEFL